METAIYLVKFIVSRLPVDSLPPEIIQEVLTCAGFKMGGSDGVVIRAEQGSDHNAELVALPSRLMKLGVIVGEVTPPTSHSTLS